MEQKTRLPISPCKAIHRGLPPSMPSMERRKSLSLRVILTGTPPGDTSSASAQQKEARKKAQQAPHLRQGCAIPDVFSGTVLFGIYFQRIYARTFRKNQLDYSYG
jgi:hypothetical protein